MRKFCGKGIFREIWKNRYVVLKGDQLYISEKEVGSVSFSFPIPLFFLPFAYEKLQRSVGALGGFSLSRGCFLPEPPGAGGSGWGVCQPETFPALRTRQDPLLRGSNLRPLLLGARAPRPEPLVPPVPLPPVPLPPPRRAGWENWPPDRNRAAYGSFISYICLSSLQEENGEIEAGMQLLIEKNVSPLLPPSSPLDINRGVGFNVGFR